MTATGLSDREVEGPEVVVGAFEEIAGLVDFQSILFTVTVNDDDGKTLIVSS